MEKITITKEDFAKAVSSAITRWMEVSEKSDLPNDVALATNMQNMLFSSMICNVLFDEKETNNEEDM